MADEKLVCYLCGAEITDDMYTEIDGEIYCDNCVEENFVICEDCGEYVDKDSTTETSDGRTVCEDCLSNNYTYCEDCEEYVPSDNVVYLNDYDKYVCEDCLDHYYYICSACDNYVHENDVCRDECGDVYCEDCYNEAYTTCDDCGCEVCRDDSYYSDYDGGTYCSDCYYDHNHDGSDEDGVIYDYHSSRVRYIPRYHDSNDEANHSKDLYGIELETAGDTSYASDFWDIMGGEQNCVLMYDSSVDGFEMVSMPITREYFYKDFVPKLQEGLEYLNKNGFRGHNRGGIHVHFRELETPMQVANMGRIMYGDEIDRKIWKRLTQRRPENMHWCSMEANHLYDTDYIIEHNLKTPHGEYNWHGTALNYDTRTCTHELRIFNSNLRIERVIKNLECVFALQDYVASASEPICDTRGFVLFVDEHAKDYPHLADFMHEKKIFDYASRLYGDTYTSSPNNVNINIDVEQEEQEDDRELAVA